MKPNEELVLGGMLAAGVLLIAAVSIVAAVVYRKKERDGMLEAASIRQKMRTEDAFPPAPPGSTSAENELEREHRAAVRSLEEVEEFIKSMPDHERTARLEKAMATFAAWLQDHPRSAPDIFRRARCLDLLGRLPEALAGYRDALKVEQKMEEAVAPRIRAIQSVLEPPTKK
jgi:tetratricopeptide (TPR) repeat protein